MGNIGNLNSSPSRNSNSNKPRSNNTTASSATRIHQDLSASPHRESVLGEVDRKGTNMLRRAAGKIPHVGIVGAGVAGLRCADILLQNGAKVTILEGRDRVGGRLCQSDSLGHVVDLGPNWIHGTDDNPMLDLAKVTDTLTMNWDGRQAVFDQTGTLVPEEEATEHTELVWTIIGEAMQVSNKDSATIPASKSLFDYFQERIEAMIPSTGASLNVKEAKRKQHIVLQMAEMWGAFVGSPIQQQSLKFFWLEECIDGENLFVADTYEKVLAKIAEPALKAKVLFNHKAQRVVSNMDKEDPEVTVELSGLESQTFDEVIFTAPLGWLKKNQDVFVPELPERLRESIKSIGYGNLDKVYFKFPTAFWNTPAGQDSTSPSTAHDSTLPNVTATTAPLHQPSPDSPVDPSHYPGFTHWAHPTYAQSTNPSGWNQEVVNLAALPSSAAHPTLLFYTFGPTSLHIGDLLANNPTSTHKDLLTTFFHPYFSRLPNYSASNPEHQPEAVLATVWTNDELAGNGSYCNFQVGLENADKDIEVMRRGMPERGVWLAGEHTSPFVALGTVTGAYWSGEGVAKRIVKLYGLSEKESGLNGGT